MGSPPKDPGATALCTTALPAAVPVCPPVVEYTIQVTLDPTEKTLDGRQRLIWRDAVSELRFHLYLNAFKNNRSTFMRESSWRLRDEEAGRKPEDWGWL